MQLLRLFLWQTAKRRIVPAMAFLFLILLIKTTSNHVLADEIFPSRLGGTVIGSSHEPKYNIELHTIEAPFYPDDDDDDDGDQESVLISSKDGPNYRCFLPKVEKAKTGQPVDQLNVSRIVVETEERAKLKTPDELIEVLKGQCFVRHEGWWSYEFCFQKKIRQLHVEDDKVAQEFILGVYDEEATVAHSQNLSDISILKDPRSKDTSQRYLAHQYTNGTMCDLTNQPRKTEIRFVCSEPRFMITSITELSTCNYALTMQCPLLCKHPLFMQDRPQWYSINCNVLPNERQQANAEKRREHQTQIMLVPNVEYPSYHNSGEKESA